MYREINVSPFATNILDIVGREDIYTAAGDTVTIRQQGTVFVVYVDGVEKFRSRDNIGASAFCNSIQLSQWVDN